MKSFDSCDVDMIRKCNSAFHGDMNGFIICSNIETKKTFIEVWGASTKHPDMKVEVEKHPYFDVPLWDIVQTAMKMGSDTLYPFHITKYIQLVQKLEKLIDDYDNTQRSEKQ